MTKIKAVFTLAATLLFALSPTFSDGFNGFTPDQFPIPQNDPPVQPAGYAFAIWGLIYLWLLTGAGFGLLKRDTSPDWTPMRAPLIISLGIGAAWIPVANVSPFWATVLIWLMWASAAVAFLRAGQTDRAFQRTPIALYLGWLTAASCVALGLMLAGHGILSGQTAATAMIALALVLAATLLRLRPDTPEFALTVIWALIGIIVTNVTGDNMFIVGLCIGGIAVIVATALRLSRSHAP